MSQKDNLFDNDIEIVDVDLQDIEDRIINDLNSTMSELENSDLPEISDVFDDSFIDELESAESTNEDAKLPVIDEEINLDDLPIIDDEIEIDEAVIGVTPAEEKISVEPTETEEDKKSKDKKAKKEKKEEKKAESAETGEKAPKQKKSAVDVLRSFLMFVAVCVLVYAGYQLTMIFMEYKEAGDEYEEIEAYVSAETVEYNADYDLGDPFDPNFTPTQVDWQGLVSLNSEIYAWIQFENPELEINYPVAKGIDNQYYLNHTVNGTENSAGSIYIDMENDPYFQDTNTFIYGHNMKNGSMFGNLKNYKNAEYYPGNEYFWIYTPDSRCRYKIFAAYEPAADSDTYMWWPEFCDEYTQYLETAKANSLYDTGVSVSGDDKIVTLSTCTSRGDAYRFIVQAKLIYREFK